MLPVSAPRTSCVPSRPHLPQTSRIAPRRRKSSVTWRHCVRGEVFRLRSPRGSKGHEQSGPRCAVVLQSDHLALSTWLVAPTSTSALAASSRPEVELLGRQRRVPPNRRPPSIPKGWGGRGSPHQRGGEAGRCRAATGPSTNAVASRAPRIQSSSRFPAPARPILRKPLSPVGDRLAMGANLPHSCLKETRK